jgi:hypothetical protein
MIHIERPYRKTLTSQGFIYMWGEEQTITVKNLSISGILAELHCSQGPSENFDVKDIYNAVTESTLFDVYLPEMRLAGSVEVARVDLVEDKVYLALEFKDIAHDVDNLLYQRKAYRKNMTAPGQILLNGEYLDFNTVNVSVDGLMIRVAGNITVAEGTTTVFEFKRLELEGEVNVIWLEHLANGDGTLLGLQYVHMEKVSISGIPRFAPTQTA